MWGVPDRFKYLPFLAPCMLIEFLLFVWVVRRCRRRSLTEARENTDDSHVVNSVLYSSITHASHAHGDGELIPSTGTLAARRQEQAEASSFLRPIPFSNTYLSYGPLTQKLLVLTRFVSSLIFLSALVVPVAVQRWRLFDEFYFTTWNLYLLTIFYANAFVASCIGLCSADPNRESRKRFGMAVHMLYEVAGSTAFLITVVAYSFIDDSFTLWNMSVHLITSGTVLIELTLNRMPVFPDHCLLSAIWGSVFLTFTWIGVGTGLVDEWPYPFMATDTPQCFLWYSGMLLGFICFFFVFERLNHFKLRCQNAYLRQKNIQAEIEAANALFTEPIDSRYSYMAA